jgi:hypothetical protein
MPTNTAPYTCGADYIRAHPHLTQKVAARQYATLTYLNERISIVRLSSPRDRWGRSTKVRFRDRLDGEPLYYSQTDIKAILANVRTLDDHGNEIQAFKWWFEHPDRSEVTDGVIPVLT